MDDSAIKAIAKIVQGKIDDTADERFLGELEEALDGDADEHQDDDPGKGLEAVRRQELVDELVGDLVIPQAPLGGAEAVVAVIEIAGDVAPLLF